MKLLAYILVLASSGSVVVAMCFERVYCRGAAAQPVHSEGTPPEARQVTGYPLETDLVYQWTPVGWWEDWHRHYRDAEVEVAVLENTEEALTIELAPPRGRAGARLRLHITRGVEGSVQVAASGRWIAHKVRQPSDRGGPLVVRSGKAWISGGVAGESRITAAVRFALMVEQQEAHQSTLMGAIPLTTEFLSLDAIEFLR